MNLVNELIKDLLPEEEKQTTTAVYAGGFKPPTSGHFEVVQQALKENPEIDEFIIFIGAKERDGISQDESLLIWEIYNNYLPFKVKIEPTSKPPIRAVYDYAKNHPTREVLWVIGAREGNEEDFKDITSRTSSISKYPNLELRTIITAGGVSGTAARNAAKVSFEKFEKFVPDVLSPEEKQEAYNLVSGKIQEVGEANVSPYKWEKTKETGYSISYEFITDSGANYLVKFHEDEDEEEFKPLESITAWEISFFVRSEVDSDGDYSYSSSRVVNKGELYKVMSTIVDITKDVIKQYPNTKKLSFKPSASKGDKTLDNQRGRLYKAFVSKQLPNAKIDQEGNTITINIPKKVSLNEIKYTNPNFDEEWKEAERYPEFVEMGKEEWVKLAKQGKSVPYSSIKKVLGNVNLDFDSLEEPKKQRFTSAFKDGNIETPIAVKFSDNDYDLVAGNTRLAGSVKNGIDPKIWVVDISDLQENSTNGKITEAKQVGNLYHYTSAEGLKGILKSNSLKASEEEYLGNELYYISFTRNKNFHKKGNTFNVRTDYRITIDGDKLSNKYKIKPFAYKPGWNYEYSWEFDWLEDEPESVARDFFDGTGDYDEQEERILFKDASGSIPNIKDYILKVDKVSDLKENYADGKEKKIVDDILSGLNESSLNGVLDKMKQYAKKGLLTLAIVASVTQGLQAQGLPQNDIDAINQQGIELVQQTASSVDRISEKLIIKYLGQEKFDNLLKLAEENSLTLAAGVSRNLSIAQRTAQMRSKSGINGTVTSRTVDSKTMKTSDGQYLVIQFIKITIQENYANSKVKGKSTLNENASYSQHIDVKQRIKELTKHMLDKGMNIQPLPKVIFKHGDAENAKQFLGKTAYYDPNNQSIVLYTEGRHPKDIVRSYAHEMIHHIQNLEGRLGNINTTNTLEDDHLDKLEQEANLGGTMTFRNWTDSLTEGKKKDPFGLLAYAHELSRGLEEQESEYKIYLDMDGVLADFDTRFESLSGISPDEFEEKYGKNKFWDFIDEEHKVGFWVGIPVMPGAKELVDYVKKYDYEILTAPSAKKQSYLGKILWVKKHKDLFGGKPRINFKKASEKHLIKPDLQKTDILIDDKQSTIDNWNAAGGTGIFYKNISQVLNDLGKLGL